MVYYNDNEILIRNMAQSDAQVITDEEIARGYDAEVKKYETRLRDQKDGKAAAPVAEYRGAVVRSEDKTAFNDRVGARGCFPIITRS